MTEAQSSAVERSVTVSTLSEIKQLEQGLLSLIVLAHLAERGAEAEEREPGGEGEIDEIPRPEATPEDLRRELALRCGDDPRTIFGLARRFGLSPGEREVLLVIAGPELDPRNRMGYARVSKLMAPDGRPTIGFVTHLLAGDEETKLDARRALGRRGALRRFRLVEVVQNRGWPEADALVSLAPSIRDLLLGHGYPLAGRPVRGIAAEAPAGVSVDLRVEADAGDPVLVVGEQGPDRRATAASLADNGGLPVLIRKVRAGESREHEAGAIAELVRDAILHGAVAAAELDDIDERFLPELLAGVLGGDGTPGGSVLLLLPHDVSGAIPEVASLCITCEARSVSYADVRRRWSEGLERHDLERTDAVLGQLAGRFRLDPWTIDAVIERARRACDGEPDAHELSSAARSLAGRRAVTHARRVTPKYRLDDMVLPDTVREHLSLLIGFAAERERLLYQYGYANRFTLGHGLISLFSGESGTGKTMAAEVLAGVLERDLYIVDLSQLVSKWVGETEKHIDQVFTEAEQAHGVLLFDEADALFSSRTNDVSSSNDRYANMEVGYLLQRIESFRGVAVLTTNLGQSIDDAFLRRFHFRIDIPRPTPDLREQLWRKMLPEGEHDEEGLDLQALAKRFDLTGGNIRNALLKATYLADRDGAKIAQQHLSEAATMECVELGRLV